MTTEQIMMKLAEIRGKSNGTAKADVDTVRESERGDTVYQYGEVSGSGPIPAPISADAEPTKDVPEIKPSSKELVELAMKWGAVISDNGFLIENSIPMTRKEYLKHTKNMNVDQVIVDPLLYIMFRSEEQGEANFFNWLERFPKAKNENNK